MKLLISVYMYDSTNKRFGSTSVHLAYFKLSSFPGSQEPGNKVRLDFDFCHMLNS